MFCGINLYNVSQIGKSIFEWGPGHNISTFTIDADAFLAEDSTIAMTIDMMAYNHFQAGYSDIFYYQVNEDSSLNYDSVDPVRCNSVANDDDTPETEVAKKTVDDGADSKQNTDEEEAPFNTTVTVAPTLRETGDDGVGDFGSAASEGEDQDEPENILSSGVDLFGDGVPLMESTANRTKWAAPVLLALSSFLLSWL